MARTLPSTLNTIVTGTVTTPAYLVRIEFATPLRLSSRGDQIWDGYTWAGGRLGQIKVTEGGGSLEMINTDLLAGALALNEGVADRRVRIWAFYGDNPATDEALPVFDGAGDALDVAPDRIRITLAAQNRRSQYSPRRFIGPSTGFNRLIPSGTRISWGGETITLERE